MNPIFCLLDLLLAAAPIAQVPVPMRDEGYVEMVAPSPPDSVVLRLASDAPASVSESRRVSLAKGTNRLRFDWSRERIDENSIHVELSSPGESPAIVARTKIRRLPQMIYIDVESPVDVEASVTTRYLLSGIGWRVDYSALLPSDGNAALLRQSVEVSNGSGKDLENVRVLFEGGAIENLTLRDGERRQVETMRVPDVPITRRYIFDAARFGATPGVEMQIENAPGGPLARPLLPSGRIRLQLAAAGAGAAAPALLGEDVFPSTPLGEKARFSTGHAQNLAVERRVVFQGNENERRDRWNKVVAYDQRTRLTFKINNGLGGDASLTVVEQPGAPYEIVSCPTPVEKKKSDSFETTIALPAGKETTVDIEWLRRNLF